MTSVIKRKDKIILNMKLYINADSVITKYTDLG